MAVKTLLRVVPDVVSAVVAVVEKAAWVVKNQMKLQEQSSKIPLAKLKPT